MISVLIADSSKMSAECLGRSLKRHNHERFMVDLPECFSSAEVAIAIERLSPQVALVSTHLRDGGYAGFKVLNHLQTVGCPTRVVMLLDSYDRDFVVDSFRGGAKGVFSRTESVETLPKCIYAVSRGEIWARNRELTFALEALAQLKPLHIVNAKGETLLSKREQEVVRLVVEGLSNRDIAQRINLSEHTVKNYLFRIYEKLGVSTRIELLLYALNNSVGDGGARSMFELAESLETEAS